MIFLKTEHNELINLTHLLRLYKELGGTYNTFVVTALLINGVTIHNLFIGDLDSCNKYIESISNQLRIRDMII